MPTKLKLIDVVLLAAPCIEAIALVWAIAIWGAGL
jgi:hypothetical protein